MVIDRALGHPPSQSEVNRGLMRARKPKTAAVTTGKPFVVIEKLQEATPRGEWLKVIVPDGELARKGNALTYVSDQSGKKNIAMFAIS